VQIPPGSEFDLDGIGRDRAETSNQVQVAFEEGYLENIYKAPVRATDRQGTDRVGVRDDVGVSAAVAAAGAARGLTGQELDDFKREFMRELREQLPQLSSSQQVEQVRAAISTDVQALVGEMKLLRERFETAKGRVREDPKLSDADVKARLAYLEEQERELLKNFETVGRRMEQEKEDGDVMDKADLLSNL
jgi:hypothetical protein